MKKGVSKKILRAGTASSIMCLSMNAFALQYTVQKGDTLSDIAAAHYPGRVYGNSGSLKQILALNPMIKKPDVIYPEQKLSLYAVEAIKLTEQKQKEKDRSQSRPKREFVPFSTLSFLPKLKYQRISGTDNANNSKAQLFSSESVEIEFDWRLHWSENFASIIGLRYTNLNYPEVSGRALKDNSVVTAGVNIGAQYKLSNKTLIYSRLEFGSHAYLYAPTSTSLRVDKGNALSNKTGIRYGLADLNPVKLNIFGGFRALAPTKVDTYESKFGYSGHLGLELSHTLKSGNRIKGLLEVEHGPQDTNPVDQTHDNMNLGIGMQWRLE